MLRRPYILAIGIDPERQKDILGMWIGSAKSSKIYLSDMNEIKKRGVRDILIASVFESPIRI